MEYRNKMRGWVTLLALLCAFQLGFGQLDTVTEVLAPSSHLHSHPHLSSLLTCSYLLPSNNPRLPAWLQASAPATSLQSRVSQVEQSLLSVANNTFQLPHLPPLQGSNKSSLLPPLPWAQPEALSDLSQAQGYAAPLLLQNHCSCPAAISHWIVYKLEGALG